MEDTDLIKAELREKKHALGLVRIKLARFGISAPVSDIMDAEDLERDIRRLERQLGIEPPAYAPTIERAYYTPPAPRPRADFEREIGAQHERMRQDEVKHQANLLSIHRRNLAHFRAQLKELGPYAPPYVRSGAQEQIQAITRIKTVLRDLGQSVDDLPGDA